jgi:hypothetical protein
MEQVQQGDIVVDGGRRNYERYGWVILLASAILGIFAAALTAIPPMYVFSSPFFENMYPIMGALGIASVGFNIFALVMIVVPYRRYERWAWYTLWLLPLQWISQFVFLPEVPYLVLAVLTAAGLILPYRRFFSRTEEPARVK